MFDLDFTLVVPLLRTCSESQEYEDTMYMHCDEMKPLLRMLNGYHNSR